MCTRFESHHKYVVERKKYPVPAMNEMLQIFRKDSSQVSSAKASSCKIVFEQVSFALPFPLHTEYCIIHYDSG